MDLFSLKATLDLDTSKYQDALSKAKNMASSIGHAVGTAMKVGTAAIGAAATAVGALGKQAVSAYASYEQLAGGVEKLYGTAADKLKEYADQAYKTSGMSANQYMETATSFSAALINSLGGDVDKAADLTDVAMRAISDNVNVFGSDMSSVQSAFQGFAKQNYTMLDNLKLGYGGTKTEMERLIKDANTYRKSIGQSANLSIESFADVVQAIQSVQEAQNIAGTTNKEAMTTIEGAANATKAAWQNVITAIGRGEGLSDAINGLISSILGSKEGEGLLNQIIPRIETVMKGIGQFIEKAGPIIGETLPKLISSVLPGLLEGAVTLIKALAQGILTNAPILLKAFMQALKSLGQALSKMLPQITEAAVDIVTTLADGIADALPELIPAVIEAIFQIVDTLLDNTDKLIDAAVRLMEGLAQGLINAIPIILEKLPIIIVRLVAGLLEAIPKLLGAGAELIGALVSGLLSGLAAIGEAGAELLGELWNSIKSGVSSAFTWGADLIKNFIDGIFSMAGKLWDGVKDIAGGIADFLGFSEPEKGPLSNFHTYAPDMMKLFAKGIRDNEDIVTDQIAKSFDFDKVIDTDLGVNASGTSTINHTGTVRIEGVNNQDEFVAASEYVIEDMITRILSRQARLA